MLQVVLRNAFKRVENWVAAMVDVGRIFNRGFI